jgi:hypothetical protein
MLQDKKASITATTYMLQDKKASVTFTTLVLKKVQ